MLLAWDKHDIEDLLEGDEKQRVQHNIKYNWI